MQQVHKGRGATLNPAGRFERHGQEIVDDGWGTIEEVMAAPGPATTVQPDRSRTVIARNDSPDIGFDASINPYRGCEHGCIYCYARPFHAFLGLSSGTDFETRIFAKNDAAKMLRAELARPGYRPEPIALGAATDPYQPVERRLRITRSILEVLADARHPVGIVTKSAGVVQDIDLLQRLAGDGLVRVQISVTTLDPELALAMEPRCSAPANRLRAIRTLAAAGIPVGVNVAPVIPGLTDTEIEAIVARAAEAGADAVFWTMVRLPFEVKDLFRAWLETHRPGRAEHVLSLIRQARGGRLNDPDFGSRMRGEGPYARLIADRFRLAMVRYGLARRRMPPMRVDLFRPPEPSGQLSLF
ncbi:PA0069 family radical SAM protein [Geminicoccus roseus]|uniref:PA0069 family radical SAM protein n=1 Tax=Geminicoccus roseus TaxID=404900 RepID=UPI0003FA447C|nr:PA0069 family radical SAM protein [Geminicoccus roseus]